MARTYHICSRRGNSAEHTGPGSGAAWGPGAILRVVLMVMMMMVQVVVVMVTAMGSVRRAGKHHQEQYGG